jgi:hypothetical protein
MVTLQLQGVDESIVINIMRFLLSPMKTVAGIECKVA